MSTRVERIVLSEHACMRIEYGDESGLRTKMSIEQVKSLINNPCRTIEFRGGSTALVFFSKIDQKCLVAWLCQVAASQVVKTIDEHRNLIPTPLILQAETHHFGTVVFPQVKMIAESLVDQNHAFCKIGTNGKTVLLRGYAQQGISWWRYSQNVAWLAGQVLESPAGLNENLSIAGQRWHPKQRKFLSWSEELPISFPQDLILRSKENASRPVSWRVEMIGSGD